MKARDHKLDVAKGVLICLVVLGHYLETSGGEPPTDLYSGWYAEPQKWLLAAVYVFHMPVFVMLAGITASPRRLAARVVQIVTIFVAFQALYLLPTALQGEHVAWAQPFFGLWFLVALVWWLISTPVIERWPLPTLAASVVVALLSGAVPLSGGYLAWSRAAYFWPFFVIGYLCGSRLLRLTEVRAPARAVAAVALFVACGGYVASGARAEWVRGSSSFEDLGVSVLAGVMGRGGALLVACMAGLCVLALIPTASRWLETLGRRSLAIYAFHIGGVIVLEQFFEREHDRLGNGLALVVALVCAAAAVVVLGYFGIFERAVRAIGGLVASRMTPSRIKPAALASRDH